MYRKVSRGLFFNRQLHYFLISNKNNSWFLRIFYLHSFPRNAKKKKGEMGPKTTGILTTHIVLPKEVTSRDLIFLACTNIVRIPNINSKLTHFFGWEIPWSLHRTLKLAYLRLSMGICFLKCSWRLRSWGNLTGGSNGKESGETRWNA